MNQQFLNVVIIAKVRFCDWYFQLKINLSCSLHNSLDIADFVGNWQTDNQKQLQSSKFSLLIYWKLYYVSTDKYFARM